MTTAERFWAKVDRTGECWRWTGAHSPKGYGKVNFRVGGRQVGMLAHRLAWELERGPIPRGLFVCHHCDNPPCVRPDHLFLGTAADNSADMMAKGRGRMPVRPRTKQRVVCPTCGHVRIVRIA